MDGGFAIASVSAFYGTRMAGAFNTSNLPLTQRRHLRVRAAVPPDREQLLHRSPAATGSASFSTYLKFSLQFL